MSEGMAAAVRAALAARKEPDPRDGAAGHLAVHYGELLDSAAPAGKYRRPLEVLARLVAGVPFDDDDPHEALHAVTTALAEHTVASDLGPKLQNALASLGLTAAARGEQRGEGKKDALGDPLTRLKEERKLRLLRGSAG